MAVVQISRIQHRRGLQQDLPQLASAELGWSVDQRRLFIGNGAIEEGAPTLGRTEILTEYTDILALANTYTFKGLSTGFLAVTGANNISVVRSLQEKLDDFVNVRDFGAKGDGSTDDTAAINRALSNTYAYSNYYATVNHRRTIYFPAGKYKVSGEIKIPPYIRLQGEGKFNTVIEAARTAALPTVFKLYDSAQQPTQNSDFGDQVGSVSPRGAEYVFNDLSIVNLAEDVLPCVSIFGGENIYFNRVGIQGPLTSSLTDRGTGYSSVYVVNDSTNIPVDNLVFNDCDFVGHGYAVETLAPVHGVTFSRCRFNNVYTDFMDAGSTGVSFDNCHYHAVELNGDKSFETKRGTLNTTEGKTISLSGSVDTPASIGIENLPSNYTNIEMSYTIKQGSNYRTGKFTVAGSGLYYQDEYVENTDLGITLTANPVTGAIRYTNDGSSSEMTYNIKYFSL